MLMTYPNKFPCITVENQKEAKKFIGTNTIIKLVHTETPNIKALVTEMNPTASQEEDFNRRKL